MQIEERDGAPERRILTAMIVDRDVLGRIADKWDKQGLFQSRWSNLIGGWCCDYFTAYGKAPRKSIESQFEQWAAGNNDKETVELVERFLESLSGEYSRLKKEINADYVTDQAGQYFNRVKLASLVESINDHLETGKVDEALATVTSHASVEIGKQAGVDVLHDADAIRRAFERRSDPIVKYPGALGNFFGDSLERDGFIAFVGPEKRGKTFWLLDVAWRAMRQGRKVAFFEVGDMSEGQILQRFMARASRRPIRATKHGHPVRWPIQIEHAPNGKQSTVESSEREYANDLTWEQAQAACEKITQRMGTEESLLRLSSHPNSTIAVSGIAALLQTWERQGWGPPDVVVIDYADVLSPPTGIRDVRDQTNAVWKQLRALSQQLHCLVVTATQADADSYKRDTMSMENFSEDKRKNAHVTGMVGINQTSAEKHLGLQRLNWLVLREGEFTSTTVCHVAGCLAAANPAILSTF